MEMRTVQAPREGVDAIKAELAFSGYDQFGAESYFVATVPLPIIRNGRRKLFMTFTEAGTRTPLKLPPNVAMAFREKFLTKIEILYAKPEAKGIVGMFSKAVGRVIGK